MARRLARWPLLVAVIAVSTAIGVVVAACERDPDPSVGAFCSAIARAGGLDESLASLDPDTLAPDVAALRKAGAVAPADISPQVDTLVQLTRALASTIDGAKTGRAEALEQTLRDRAGDLAAVTDAGQAVQTYTSVNCGVELNSTAVSTSAAGPTVGGPTTTP